MTRAERRRRKQEERPKGRPRALGVDWTLERTSSAVAQGYHAGGDSGRSLTDEEVEGVRSAVSGILNANRGTLAHGANERLGVETWQVEALNTAMTLPLCERLMRLGVEPPTHAILATVLGEGPQLAEIVTDEKAFVAVTFKSGTKLILPGTALYECTQDITAIRPAAPAAAFALFAGGWRGRADGRPGTVFSTSVLAWDVGGLAVTAPGSAVDVLIRRATKAGPLGARRRRAAMFRRIREDIQRDKDRRNKDMRHHQIAKSAVVGEITDPTTLRVPLAGWIQRPGPAVRSWFDTGASFVPWLFLRLLDELLEFEQPLGSNRRPVMGGDEGLRAMDKVQADVIPVENAQGLRDVETAKDFATVSRHKEQLADAQRQAFDYALAAEREGETLQAFCEARGLSYDTVRQRFLRAKRQLRKIIDD